MYSTLCPSSCRSLLLGRQSTVSICISYAPVSSVLQQRLAVLAKSHDDKRHRLWVSGNMTTREEPVLSRAVHKGLLYS